MKTLALILAMLFALLTSTPEVTLAGDDRVQWSDVRGIIQPMTVVGTGSGAVTGGGAPWTTTGGRVQVNLDDGSIAFNVRGLVLAAGNSIGTRGGVAMVKGTLVCDTDGSLTGQSILVETGLVTLDEQGDAQFDGGVGAFPPECFERDIAFLIRAGNGPWIAFGAVRRP